MTSKEHIGRTFAEALRSARARADLTQEELAARLGTTRYRIIKWEKLDSNERPGAYYAERLQDVLGLPDSVFRRGEDAPLYARVVALETLLGERKAEAEKHDEEIDRLREIAESLSARVDRLEDAAAVPRRKAK